MSALQAVVVCCDWPGCEAEAWVPGLSFGEAYDEIAANKWLVLGRHSRPTRVYCPDHVAGAQANHDEIEGAR